MAANPLLPKYTDEKSDTPRSPYLSEDLTEGLRIGQGRSYLDDIKQHPKLPFAKKAIIAIAALWVIWQGARMVSAYMSDCGMRGFTSEDGAFKFRPGHFEMSDADFEPQDATPMATQHDQDCAAEEEGCSVMITFIPPMNNGGEVQPPARYHESVDTDAEASIGDETHRGQRPQSLKAIAIDIRGHADAALLISVADVCKPQVKVESRLAEVDHATDIRMFASENIDVLAITPESDAVYTVHLTLPLRARRVPPLNIRAPAGLPIHFDASVAGREEALGFSDLIIASETDIELSEQVNARSTNLKSTTGKIKGTFNVSEALVLHTVTGDIDVEVFARPHHHHHRRNSGTHGHHEGPHRSGRSKRMVHHGRDRRHRGHTERRGWMASIADVFAFGSGAPHHRGGARPPHHRPPPSHDHSPHSGPPHGAPPQGHPPRGPPPHGPPPHGPPPPGPPHHGGQHPPPPGHGKHGKHHPPPPRPVFIGAFSTTGNIKITEHQPHFLSTVTHAVSHTGNVTVHAAESFKGLFEAETKVGALDISAGQNKLVKFLKEVVSETGKFEEGLVRNANSTKKHEAEESDDIVEDVFEVIDMPDEGSLDGPQRPPPPGSPGRGRRGGPPQGPPGRGRRRGPPGPHHRHPHPPPGFSKLIAKTDVGGVKLAL